MSKKSADFRWASRSALPLSMLAICAVSVALEADGLAPSRVMEALNSLNEPRTLVTMACRATKPKRVWAGSMVQVPLYWVRSVMSNSPYKLTFQPTVHECSTNVESERFSGGGGVPGQQIAHGLQALQVVHVVG